MSVEGSSARGLLIQSRAAIYAAHSKAAGQGGLCRAVARGPAVCAAVVLVKGCLHGCGDKNFCELSCLCKPIRVASK